MSKWQNNKKKNTTILLTIKEIVKQIASRTRQGEKDNQINRTRRDLKQWTSSLRLSDSTRRYFGFLYVWKINTQKRSCCTSTNVADYTIHLLYNTLLHECETSKKCSARHTNFSYLSSLSPTVSWQIIQVLKWECHKRHFCLD